MIKSIPLPSLLVLLLLGLAGCSRQAPAPVLSMTNEKAASQTPTDPPQGFKELWAEANPLPEWTNPGKGETNKLPQQIAATDGKGLDMEKIFLKLEQIERRLDEIEKRGRFQHLTAAEIREEVEQVFGGILVGNLCKINPPAEPQFHIIMGFNH